MVVTELLEKYNELNNSFENKLFFKFGTNQGSGFYSELNSLLLGVLFALQRQYKFVLYSRDASFAFGNGWEEFFEPFCPTMKNRLLGYGMGRGMGNRKDILTSFYTMFNPKNKFENNIFWYLHSNWFGESHFNIPSLGINGNIRDALKVLIPMVYRFNGKYTKLIEDFIKKINLPQDYVSFHIRGGDKVTEKELYNPQDYFKMAEDNTDCRNAFVFTDDYRLFQQVRDNNPQWNVYTSAFEYEDGFVLKSFSKKDDETLRNELVKIFSSVQIILQSKLFYGTYSSNPGMFIGMQMDEDRMKGLDYKKWVLF